MQNQIWIRLNDTEVRLYSPQEAMTKATIRGRCTYCRSLTVLTQHNLHQRNDHRFTLICEDCEERYGTE